MLSKNPLIWAAGLAALFIIVLTFWMPFKEAAKFTFAVYFIFYLPGYFFLQNFYKADSMLEQNSLSLTMGIAMIATLSYAVRELRIIYNQTTIIILAGSIIIVSLLWEQVRQRKNLSGTRKRRGR